MCQRWALFPCYVNLTGKRDNAGDVETTVYIRLKVLGLCSMLYNIQHKIHVYIYCRANQEWQWRYILFTIVK